MGRRILIASGKGGVGKTTITAGLGISLARSGVSVVIIDGDMGLSNLDTLMNIDGKVIFDLYDLMQKKCRIKQALVADENLDNLYTLASSHARVGEELSDDIRFSYITQKLAEVFDYVLIDAPAGASSGFKTCLAGSDEAIIVVTPHTSSIRDADKVIGLISASGQSYSRGLKFVINRIRGDLVLSKQMLSHKDISQVLPAKLIGIIPESDWVNVYSSLVFSKLASRDAEQSFSMLADNIHNGKSYLFDYMKKYKGLSGIIRRGFYNLSKAGK